MGKLTGKKAIITGGSRGIGKAIAIAYAREGAEVVIVYHKNAAEAQAVVAEINRERGLAIAIQADVATAAGREKIIKESVACLGEINILVNNAGIYFRKDYLNITEKEYDDVMNVNVKGPFLLTQLVVKQMIGQQKGGSILNISSFRDRAVSPGGSHYQTSKAAMSMFSKSAAVEVAKYGIRVNTISPGMILTDMHKGLERGSQAWADRVNSIPLKRPGQTQDLTPLAVLLASDDADYVTASRFVVDGGNSTNPANLPLRAKL